MKFTKKFCPAAKNETLKCFFVKGQGIINLRRSTTGMRQVLNAFGQSYKIFLAVAAILAVQLFGTGKLHLCGAILVGAILTLFWFLSTAARLETIIGTDKEKAKRIMLVGLLFRLGMVFAVLGVAVHISADLFIASASCFGTFYLTALAVLVKHGRR